MAGWSARQPTSNCGAWSTITGRSACRERGVNPASGCVRRLVDDYRAQCLWFLRDGYYPETTSEREQVLAAIARHGDLRAFRRVAEVRAWLSQDSSGTSAGS
ncbi:MAG: hypothetical protein IT176_07445 [Acidobacteria bacterium]|nr:hypothetical protein [Acidobacteriota bacterium]